MTQEEVDDELYIYVVNLRFTRLQLLRVGLIKDGGNQTSLTERWNRQVAMLRRLNPDRDYDWDSQDWQ